MQTGADIFSPSAVLIFKSPFIYSSAPPPLSLSPSPALPVTVLCVGSIVIGIDVPP